LRYRLKVTARGNIAVGVFFDSSAKLLIFLNMVVLAITVTKQLTRHSNGQKTVGFVRCALYFNQLFFAA